MSILDRKLNEDQWVSEGALGDSSERTYFDNNFTTSPTYAPDPDRGKPPTQGLVPMNAGKGGGMNDLLSTALIGGLAYKTLFGGSEAAAAAAAPTAMSEGASLAAMGNVGMGAATNAMTGASTAGALGAGEAAAGVGAAGAGAAGAGSFLGPAGAGFAGGMLGSTLSQKLFPKAGRGGKMAGGALGGAAAGAAMGSVVPGVGTLIGGVVGGISGLLSGLFKDGGMVGYADGGEVPDEGYEMVGPLDADGHDGRSDDLAIAVSEGEYVLPADIVSALGLGSSEAGADKIDQMITQIRNEYIDHLSSLPPPRGALGDEPDQGALA